MNKLIATRGNIKIMQFRFIKYIICCSIIFFPMIQYGQNLIVNPDCEEPLVGGEIPDWTEVVGTSWGTGGINPTAQSGSVYFYAGANSSAELAQDIDVSAHAVSIDNNSQSFTFSGYVRNFNGNDLSRFIVEYRDAANTSVLDSYDSGNVDNVGSWLLLSDTRNAPSGTRFIRIRLVSTRVSGSNNDGYYDNLSLTTTTSLPVELIDFEVKNIENYVSLDWQTATEINNSHFDVEWSKDGIDFEKIGEVAGNGTTTEVQFYDFLHKNPANGENYYRLRQVDFDKKYEYTDILNIEYQTRNIEYRIFPNPASHYLKIESEEIIGEIVQLFNVNGQLVKEFQHQRLITNLPIADLSSGTYFIKMGNQFQKLIITR